MKHFYSFTQKGVTDWILQRITAIYLLVYFVVLVGFFFTTHNINFGTWKDFALSTPMQIAHLFALLSLVAHAWLGIWIVLTDYVPHKFGRFVAMTLVAILLLSLLVWGMRVIW